MYCASGSAGQHRFLLLVFERALRKTGSASSSGNTEPIYHYKPLNLYCIRQHFRQIHGCFPCLAKPGCGCVGFKAFVFRLYNTWTPNVCKTMAQSKPRKRSHKAISLHTLGVQVEADMIITTLNLPYITPQPFQGTLSLLSLWGSRGRSQKRS